MNELQVWKLSHGERTFAAEERKRYLDSNLAVMDANTGKGQGENFLKAPVGTVFFLCHGNEQIEVLAQFVSAAEEHREKENRGGTRWYQRQYRVLKRSIRQGPYTGATKRGWTPDFNSTFMQVGDPDLEQFESELLKPFFGIDLQELSRLATSQQSLLEDSGHRTRTSRAKSINRIYYGPPGTGKTFTVAKLLREQYEQAADALHPEDWQQQFIDEHFAGLKWREAIVATLYELGHEVKVAELASHRFIKAVAGRKSNNSIVPTLWTTLLGHAVPESETVTNSSHFEPTVFDKSPDSTWRLAGDWRDACADIIAKVDEFKRGPVDAKPIQRHVFVTFHQSYGYEEFVEGLRPVLDADDSGTGDIAYEIRPGTFRNLCRIARQSPDKRFAIVIDEINRGNVSKIFGELISLIEPDKRAPLDGSRPPFEVTLAYSGEKFSVPANVDIYGTMNTADRSLTLLDTALRRRFEFVPLLPQPELLAELSVATEYGTINVARLLETINRRIEALYDRDHCIGHAYFMGLAEADDRFVALQDVFRKRIIPLLEEYFFEDWRRIQLVLGDNQKQDPRLQFVRGLDGYANDLDHLFGGDHELDAPGYSQCFYVQDEAFADPRAYLGIYGAAEAG